MDFGNNARKRGGGEYNEQGIKYCKWIEQRDDFWIENQVTYNGEQIDGKNMVDGIFYIDRNIQVVEYMIKMDQRMIIGQINVFEYATHFYINILVDVNSFSQESITMVQSAGLGILLFGIFGDSNLIICKHNL
ncbi:unnamed protein product [Paramecium pentaurelia]|uniref:Uncharacterized protein n=1 Tax=Paramecium pentaurelia TaxID=43138 RepID=A0A8S1SNA0_9CILI|nr:unnamed protein product [Paramecium pentaurelia]